MNGLLGSCALAGIFYAPAFSCIQPPRCFQTLQNVLDRHTLNAVPYYCRGDLSHARLSHAKRHHFFIIAELARPWRCAMGSKTGLLCAVVTWLISASFAAAAGPFTYELTDSTIGLLNKQNEPLTGTFRLISDGSSLGYQTYVMSDVSWSSPSFAVTNDQTDLFTVQVSLADELAIFDGTLNLTGFSDSKGTLGSSSANTLYSGASSMPLFFSSNILSLRSASTDQQIGTMLVDAELVPEPSTLTLLALGGVGLAVVRRRQH
jgi:PEP-CTERM motif